MIGYSIPSFFGYLTTRNPIKALIHILTLGQADNVIRIASGGHILSLAALWDNLVSTPRYFLDLETDSEMVGVVEWAAGVSASLLSLGLGFRPDLTGAENALLANLLQGMSDYDAYLNIPYEIEARQIEGYVSGSWV